MTGKEYWDLHYPHLSNMNKQRDFIMGFDAALQENKTAVAMSFTKWVDKEYPLIRQDWNRPDNQALYHKLRTAWDAALQSENNTAVALLKELSDVRKRWGSNMWIWFDKREDAINAVLAQSALPPDNNAPTKTAGQ